MEQLVSLRNTLSLPQLGRGRSLVLGAVAVAVLAAVAFVALRSAEPMGLLYSGLDPSEAGKLGQRLEELKVPFEAKGDGTTILVPASQVARVRMELAASGLPHQGGAGYELLDSQSPMNMTSFMQRVQRVRALEGELARTIAAMDGVRSARVHIVMPEREGFSRETPQPTAAITVTMAGAGRMTPSQAAAVRLLVAGAVPRMRAEEVSVLDPAGVVLAADDGSGLAVGRLGDIKSAQEKALQRTVTGLLEPLVGVGKVRVAVAQDLESTRETQREEKFDPLSQVERSRQTQNDRDNSEENKSQPPVTVGQNVPNQAVGANGGNRNTTTSAHNGETVNYEISSVTSERVREPGELRRLTVAVVVDGTMDAKGGYTPRAQEELDRLGELVRSAVGYNEKRGDRVTIETLHFVPVEALGTGSGASELAAAGMVDIRVAAGAGAALVVVMGILMTMLMRRRRKQEAAKTEMLLEAAGAASPARLTEDGEDLFSIGAVGGKPRNPLTTQLQTLVDDRPEEVLSVLQGWIESSVT